MYLAQGEYLSCMSVGGGERRSTPPPSRGSGWEVPYYSHVSFLRKVSFSLRTASNLSKQFFPPRSTGTSINSRNCAKLGEFKFYSAPTLSVRPGEAFKFPEETSRILLTPSKRCVREWPLSCIIQRILNAPRPEYYFNVWIIIGDFTPPRPGGKIEKIQLRHSDLHTENQRREFPKIDSRKYVKSFRYYNKPTELSLYYNYSTIIT